MDDIDRSQLLEEQHIANSIAAARRQVRPGQIAPEFCSDCGDKIPMKRRKAVPWTERCVDCQELAERP